MKKEHYRQPFVETDPKCRQEVFDCLREIRCEGGIDPEELSAHLMDFFDLTMDQASRITGEWVQRNQAILESFGIW